MNTGTILMIMQGVWWKWWMDAMTPKRKTAATMQATAKEGLSVHRQPKSYLL